MIELVFAGAGVDTFFVEPVAYCYDDDDDDGRCDDDNIMGRLMMRGLVKSSINRCLLWLDAQRLSTYIQSLLAATATEIGLSAKAAINDGAEFDATVFHDLGAVPSTT